MFGDGERELAAGASQGRKGTSQAERSGKAKARQGSPRPRNSPGNLERAHTSI